MSCVVSVCTDGGRYADLQLEFSSAVQSSAEQRALILKLEHDLSSIQTMSSMLRPDADGADLTSMIDTIPEPIKEATAMFAGLPQGELPQGQMDSLLSIISSQRERFRSHNQELEAESRSVQVTMQGLQRELDSLRADNIKLYEKIKFLQSYPGRVSRFLQRYPGRVSRFLQSYPGRVSRFLQSYPGRVSRFLQRYPGRVSRFLQSYPGRVSRFLQSYPGRVSRFLQSYPGKVSRFLQSYPGRVSRFLQSYPGRVSRFLQSYPGRVSRFLQSYPGRVSRFLQSYPGRVSRFLQSYPGRFLQSYYGRVSRFLQSYPGRVSSFLQSYPGRVSSFLQSYPGRVSRFLQSYPGRVSRFLQSYPGRVSRFLQSYPVRVSSFLQSYPGRVSSFLQSYPGRAGGSDDTVTVRYSSQYEERLDPFASFSKRERHHRYLSLSPWDKVTLSLGRSILSNKMARTITFFYTLFLHCLVFLVLYETAWSESIGRDCSAFCAKKYSDHLHRFHENGDNL
ncbi:uncharacterized protein LOC129832506 [Salvelinus fontinalis]|uniref:uncharacterized protein LOC129832506 n=1 Tax=Salvelinus fontinalis TaxID=8038 RepID=UPI002485B1E0|nr:uncharacterized protein LOC129832506 [Salvelinus fontinalis]